MLRSALLTIVICVMAMTGFAQTPTIKGVVTDKTDTKPLAGATVSLLLQKDSTLVGRKVTDASGLFQFNPSAPDSFIVTVDLLNYQQYVSFFTLRDSMLTKEMGVLSLDRQGTDLNAVTIISKAAPVTQKGDTAQFSASQYKVNPDATTEDLIKKMPGITVDRDGTVTAQGEQVKKVTIDGKDFFGDDASAALKNLPSEIVDKIQVFDRLSDQAQQTGIDDGNTVKALNIVTKSGIKNGQFGRVYAGYGTDDRYAAGGNASFFKGDRRLSIVGNFNNINQQNFGSQDLLGVTSSGGGNRGGGMGGRGGGNFGGGNNFTVGQSAGISKTNAAGLNYSNKFGKLTLTASYFFNQSNNNNDGYKNTETFLTNSANGNLFSEQNSVSSTKSNNHRINMRLEYKIDDRNSIFYIPSFSFQDNKSNTLSDIKQFYATGDSVKNSMELSDAERNGYNIRNNIMWRHNFAKKGRVLSIGFNSNNSRNTADIITQGNYRYFDATQAYRDSVQNRYNDNMTNNNSYGANLAYVEPIGKKGQLQFEYNPTIQKNKADQQAFNFDGTKYSVFDTSLSNKFDNTVTTHRGGITYRYQESRDAQFSVGLNVQGTELESERVFPTTTSVKQNFFNLLPNAMYRKKFNAKNSVRLFYRAGANFPSVNQLQDVYDLSNSFSVSVGNPGLKQSTTQFLGGGYTYTNSKTGTSFFANIFAQTANDYIANSTTLIEDSTYVGPNLDLLLVPGTIVNRPVNVDGYRSFRSFLTYSMPLKFIKTTMNLNAGYTYSRLPGIADNVKTITNNQVYNAGIVLASNISEYIDFNINYNASFNNTKSTVANDNNYVNQTTGLILNLLNKKGWFIQNDVTNQTYSGLTAGLNQSYWLWNAAIGKKFLKNRVGELKLSVFDLLKQNQAITRTVDEKSIVDSRNLVLQQYFMLTFTYNLKNFGTAKKSGGAEEEGPRRFGPGGPGGGGPGF